MYNSNMNKCRRDEEYIHGFSCKSKFCTKCGRMYSIKWAEKQADNMLNVKHRH
ncbi:transposase zinc-binding domain-containing protein, partial [Terrisporobacter othiniensis]|uniref:transposase zinc-binding domain-containing protein n=1 Tax=Terrisporobacter othiniensis TaxID=1577792 RepID=UPI003FCE15E1